MALLTTHHFFLAKLATMHVLMAIPTAERQRAIAHHFGGQDRAGRAAIGQSRWRNAGQRWQLFSGMAFPAHHFLMRAQQGEARLVVIELGLMPALIHMTNLATAPRHARGELSGMRVQVAGGAALLRKSKEQLACERARGLACVAKTAGRCQVRARQLK